ncbi:MAG: hypothetical protein RJA44_663 [Pseudomonadota bacterium]
MNADTEPQAQAPHASRLDQALLTLLASRSIAALGTLQADGAPFVSMAPYALLPDQPALVMHVSGLAAHTRQMAQDGRVSLLITAAEDADTPPQAVARVTLTAQAVFTDAGSAEAQACRSAYLARHPQAEPITALPDFSFVRLDVAEARQIAGFGAARSVSRAALQSLWPLLAQS